MLNVTTHDGPASDTKTQLPLLIVHGLFGAGRNWGVIAKRLSDERTVIAPDMRNHGDSFWADTHGYPEMAGDLAEIIEANGGKADVVGHSMGGKAAMALALTRPELVNSLLVADIAPVTYAHDQSSNIAAMQAVDLSRVTRRSEVSEALSTHIDTRSLQSFLAQSYDPSSGKWMLNLDVLSRDMAKILGFPEIEGHYDGPVLFLSGALSDYVQTEHRPQIKALFPKARFAKLPDTGHWLHAEKPRDFEASVRAFLAAID